MLTEEWASQTELLLSEILSDPQPDRRLEDAVSALHSVITWWNCPVIPDDRRAFHMVQAARGGLQKVEGSK